MENSPIEFIVVAEARADAEIATQLADRVLVERGLQWLDADLLPHLRLWTGVERERFIQGESETVASKAAKGSFTRVDEIGRLYEKYRRVYRLPRQLRNPRRAAHTREYYWAAKAILLAQRLVRSRLVRALLLVRDMDNQPKRQDDLETARAEYTLPSFKIVLGIENPKREAWMLNGFECQSEAEEARLRAERKRLGFDPRTSAKRLSAARGTRTAKHVLDTLTESSYEREALCWRETPLDTLGERGAETGLKAYLDEIENRLLPLLDGNQPRE